MTGHVLVGWLPSHARTHVEVCLLSRSSVRRAGYLNIAGAFLSAAFSLLERNQQVMH